jgi:hypothetical protein
MLWHAGTAYYLREERTQLLDSLLQLRMVGLFSLWSFLVSGWLIHVSLSAKYSLIPIPIPRLGIHPATSKSSEFPSLEHTLLGNKPDSGSIIAVHRLNPKNTPSEEHAWNTWKTCGKNGDRLWLRDNLPEHTPGARIFLYQYDSRAFYGGNHATFMDKANDLIYSISLDREVLPQ